MHNIVLNIVLNTVVLTYVMVVLTEVLAKKLPMVRTVGWYIKQIRRMLG